jgi:NADPH:quinone reductase-like Zn-dependent oxidoreductase
MFVAVAVAAGKPPEISTIQIEGPRESEVLVEIEALGVCHTDEFTLSGADPALRHSKSSYPPKARSSTPHRLDSITLVLGYRIACLRGR